MQRLRTDSQKHHPQGLETLLEARTSPLQPVDMPLGFTKLANETLSGCCPSHLTKDAPQKMVQKGILGKCCQWRSQLHQRKVLNGTLTKTTCSGVDVARGCLAAEPPRLSVEQGCATKVDIQSPLQAGGQIGPSVASCRIPKPYFAAEMRVVLLSQACSEPGLHL